MPRTLTAHQTQTLCVKLVDAYTLTSNFDVEATVFVRKGWQINYLSSDISALGGLIHKLSL
jgi:hypothetical protein